VSVHNIDSGLIVIIVRTLYVVVVVFQHCYHYNEIILICESLLLYITYSLSVAPWRTLNALSVKTDVLRSRSIAFASIYNTGLQGGSTTNIAITINSVWSVPETKYSDVFKWKLLSTWRQKFKNEYLRAFLENSACENDICHVILSLHFTT